MATSPSQSASRSPAILPGRHLILNEISNVVLALRTNSRFSSLARFRGEIPRRAFRSAGHVRKAASERGHSRLLIELLTLRDVILQQSTPSRPDVRRGSDSPEGRTRKGMPGMEMHEEGEGEVVAPDSGSVPSPPAAAAYPDDGVSKVLQAIRSHKHVLPERRKKRESRQRFDNLPAPLTLLRPFFSIIESEETPGPITGVALNSVKKFLRFWRVVFCRCGGASRVPFPLRTGCTCRIPLEEIVRSVRRCQFEVTDVVTDESVLVMILDVLLEALKVALTFTERQDLAPSSTPSVSVSTPASATASTTASATTTSEDLHVPRRPSPSLLADDAKVAAASARTRPSDMSRTERIALGIFRGCFRIGREMSGGTRRLGEGLRRTCEKYLEEMTELVFREVVIRGGSESFVESVVVPVEDSASHDFSSRMMRLFPSAMPSSPVVTPPFPFAVPYPEMASLFKFIIRLCDPLRDGKTGSLRLLGLTLSSLVVDILGKSIVRFPKLLKLAEDELCRVLLRNATSTNSVILSQTLRGIEGLVLALPPQNIHRQLEAFLITCHLRVILSRDASSCELQELCLESLIQMCTFEDFAVRLYREYDCDDTSYDLLESIVNVLAKTVRQSESLNALHILSLKGLLQIIHSLVLRPTATDFRREKMLRSRRYQHYRDLKTRKCKMMELCNAINKRPLEGYAALLQSKEFVRELSEDELAKFELGLVEEEVEEDDAAAVAVKGEASEEQTKAEKEGSSPAPPPPEPEDPREIARRHDAVAFLHKYSKWLSKHALGALLHEVQYRPLLKAYMKQFDFRGLQIDEGLRLMVFHFFLHGEGQQVTAILDEFARRYFALNQADASLCYFDAQPAAFQFVVWMIMLHTETHNPHHRGSKMSFDRFQASCMKVIFRKSERQPPKGELRRVYDSIVHQEMFSSSNNCDHFRSSDHMWNAAVVDRSRQFRSPSPEAFYASEMFETIWGSIAVALRVVLDHTRDDYVIKFAFAGFRESAEIAATYDLSKTLDHVVVSLGKMSQLLEASSSEDSPGSSASENFLVRFGANKIARVATKTMFQVTRHHGDALREGWRSILDIVIRLFELGVLHVPFMGDKDVYYAHRERRKKEEASGSVASSGSWFPFWGAADDDGTDKESIERAEECVKDCRIVSLLIDVRSVNSLSLEYLVKAASRVARRGKKLYTVLFCLQVLVEIAGANPRRIRPLWSVLHDQFSHFIDVVKRQFQKNRGRLAEKEVLLLQHCVDCVVVLRGELWKKQDLRSKLEESFKLVADLPVPMLSHVLGQVCLRIADGTYLVGMEHSAYCAWLVSVVRATMAIRDGVAFAKRACDALTKIDPFPFRVEEFVAVVGTVCPDQGLSEHLGVLFRRLHQAKDKEWVFVFRTLGRNCLDASNRVLRNSSLSVLQRILLDASSLTLFSLGDLQLIFDDTLLPVMNTLLTERQELRQMRLRFSSLLSRTFLHFLSELQKSDLKMLLVLWLKILRVVKSCMSSTCEFLIESTPQLLKNMVLVMRAQKVLTEEVWASTVRILHGEALHRTLCEIAALVDMPKPEPPKPESTAEEPEALHEPSKPDMPPLASSEDQAQVPKAAAEADQKPDKPPESE